ncbi:MAG: PAS domain S-box-containing protein [Candidatus Endobugula sp.]|jgi:PAS domain S-box-containing protein
MSLWLPEDALLERSPELLQQALARYRRVLDGSGYAFWEWGLHDDSYSCGGRFWATLGYMTLDEAVTCVDNVQEYVHPDDFKMVSEVVLKHLRFNTPIDMVYRVKAKDGRYWWTQACASSTRDEHGRVTHLSGINFDLSHLKETEKSLRLSEARHERILAASNDGIWEWSIDENNEDGLFHTSHSCWKHLDYTEEEVDALPENERLSIWVSHIHPDDLLYAKRAMKRHFILKETFDVEYRMFDHEGNIFWMRSRGQAIFNGAGRAILMSGVNIEITALKEAEERVNKAKNEAEKANNAKSLFLSSMSHELRTPLNAIMGFSQVIIKNASLLGQQSDNAQQVYSAGEHLLRLVNDVLDLTQVEAGKISLAPEPVLAKRIVEECFALVSSLAEQRGIHLSCKESMFDSAYVYVDSMRLKQCLLNLINNAVKYNIDYGKVVVSFQKKKNDLHIIVEDTGHGIPKDKQHQLFQPFNRLGAEHSTIEGSGIGLVVTKQLIEKMRGQLHYQDAVFENGNKTGAAFTISLPIFNVKSAQVLEVRENAASFTATNIELVASVKQTALVHFQCPQSIIYIEDNLLNIYLMESFLSEYSQISLNCYSDPLLGLHKIRNDLPKLILLDVNFPGVSGIEIVKIIKSDKLTRHIPVVALSANAMPLDIQKGKEAGFDEYLTKPVDINILLSMLNNLLPKQASA